LIHVRPEVQGLNVGDNVTVSSLCAHFRPVRRWSIITLSTPAGIGLWERSPLQPRADNVALQEALLAKLPADKAWHAYVCRYRKHYKKVAYRKQEKTPSAEAASSFAGLSGMHL